MVEFPWLVPVERKGFAAPVVNLTQMVRFAEH